MPPGLVIEAARRRGLDGIAITDHDTVQGALAARKANRHPDFLVIPGIEVKTDRGDVIGLFIEREISSRRFGDVLCEIHRQGGLVYLPHPMRTFGASGTLDVFRDFPDIDLWEMYNGRYEAKDFAASQEVFGTLGIRSSLCGSDAHAPWEIGAFRTVLPVLPRTPELLLRSAERAMLDAVPRGDFALSAGIALGAMIKAYKQRQYGKLGGGLAALPWKVVRRVVRRMA
jgi:predicted metal-dependent phosphoesterase TrpH